MALSNYDQLVWLVDTIRSAGHISKSEIDALWASSPLNVKKETVYPLRSFHRHRQYIADKLHVNIDCDWSTQTYYIAHATNPAERGISTLLSNTMAVSNTLTGKPEIAKRVIFEEKEHGFRHLPSVIEAMYSKMAIVLHFVKEADMQPVSVVPYCLREVDGEWLLAAKPVDGKSEVQVYYLKEVEMIHGTKQSGKMPRFFNGEVFFASWQEQHQPKKKVVKKATAEKPAKKEKAPKKEEKKAPQKVEKKVVQEQAQLSLF